MTQHRQNVWRRMQPAFPHRIWMLRLCALALPCWPVAGASPAQAEAPGVVSDTAALLERVRLLERRLAQIEQAQPAGRRTAAASAPPRGQPAASLPAGLRQTAASPPPVASMAPATSTETARSRDPRDDEIPQEAFIFRDQAVTLRPGQGELSLDLGYLRDRRTITADRSGSAVVTARMGIIDGVEASVTVPFFQSTRTFERSPSFITDRETQGIGDVAAQVNIRGWGERPLLPGAIFTAAMVTPTGPSPFVVPARGLQADLVPVDITQMISTRGAWALRAGVQLFKTVDPLVIFGGLSYEYVFPLEQSGVTFRPGRRFNYNAGISFALSERSTLGFTFIGSYTSALQANGISYRNTASEAAILRLSLIQRLGANFWLEPALGMGLVADSPNYQLGLGLRYRF